MPYYLIASETCLLLNISDVSYPTNSSPITLCIYWNNLGTAIPLKPLRILKLPWEPGVKCDTQTLSGHGVMFLDTCVLNL